MSCHPASEPSIKDLRKLRDTASARGDECLATMLAGVDLYIAMGREVELLDIMRRFANEVRETVESTPSADDLKRLYELDDPGRTQ